MPPESDELDGGIFFNRGVRGGFAEVAMVRRAHQPELSCFSRSWIFKYYFLMPKPNGAFKKPESYMFM